ncbi:MAG: hypothetical protein Q8M16_10715 [Pirellulaceae bacterium]|nr:hypothetical protein [Pirellulaceae bacterium]
MLVLRQSCSVGMVMWLVLLSVPSWGQSPFRNLLPGSKPQEQTTEAAPAPPRLFQRLTSPFRRVNHEEAEKGYALEMTDGPWMIMCASFLGEGRRQAEDLCKELRSIGFKAYLYEHSFDYTNEIQGLGYSVARSEGLVDQYDLAPAKMRAANPVRFDDVSVLVGHFSSAEDPRAEKTLEEIKRLFPKSLHVSENSRSFQRMSGYREWVRSVSKEGAPNKNLGPMRGAFVVPNPLLPEDFFERQVVDPMVIKMNKGNKYSLLDNPKNYTVKVATFTGDTTFDQADIDAKTKEFNFLLRSGKGLTESKLMEAESNANYLADLLRRQGFEAYSYHDRDSSIVCVGSFDWVVKNPDSRNPTINPASQDVVDKFKAKVIDNIPGVAPFFQPRTVKGPTEKNLSFDLIPVSVAVPRLK